MTAASLLVLLLAAQPVIASHASCPSARDIASQLAVLMPENAQPGAVVVSTTTDGLLIDLRPENPTFAALRTVTVGDDCDERARITAVVISTWWPLVGAEPRSNDAVAVRPATPIAVEAPARTLRLAAGGFVSVTGDGPAPGGRVELTWQPARARGFGLRASTSYTAAREVTLGRGRASWSRATAELGPALSLGHFRLDAGAALGRLWIDGQGFDEGQSSQGNTIGMTVGTRAEWPWGRLAPWIEMRGLLWPQAQSIYVLDVSTGQRTSHAVPRAELQLGAGIALVF
jgi:hypothetical protein